MADETFEARLQQIWQQGHRSMAAAFLRRAMTPETSLADVAKALQFEEVRDFLGSLRLADVMRDLPARPPVAHATTPAPLPAAQPGHASPMPSPAGSEPTPPRRRRRRAPSEMAEIKDLVASMLEAEPGSLNTTEMHNALGDRGFELDRLTLNRLLVQLEEEGKVVCLGGRPKGWRSAAPAAARRAAAKKLPAAQAGGGDEADGEADGEGEEAAEGG